MPGYLIRHAKGPHGDIHIEDPGLTVKLRAGWLYIHDTHDQLVLAVPAEQIASVQRVDEDQEQRAEE